MNRAGEEPEAQSDCHAHHYPAAELLGKMMIPIIIDVRARSVEELGGLVRHAGEEYLYVLCGEMELHSDLYAPLPLGRGTLSISIVGWLTPMSEPALRSAPFYLFARERGFGNLPALQVEAGA